MGTENLCFNEAQAHDALGSCARQNTPRRPRRRFNEAQAHDALGRDLGVTGGQFARLASMRPRRMMRWEVPPYNPLAYKAISSHFRGVLRCGGRADGVPFAIFFTMSKNIEIPMNWP